MLTAEENITLPLLMDGRKLNQAHLEQILDMHELKAHRNHLPSQMSGGNLDSRNSAEIMELFRRSNRELKQTILIITHNETIAEQCDRIIVRKRQPIPPITKTEPGDPALTFNV